MNALIQMMLEAGPRETISAVLVGIGILAMITGAFGLIRLPCVFSRSHGSGMIDTAGVAFVVLGLLVYEGPTLIAVKLILVGVFLFFTSPIATHALVQVAYRSGVRPAMGTKGVKGGDKAQDANTANASRDDDKNAASGNSKS